MGVPQALHDITVSLVGVSGMSSRPPHFSHSNLLTEVILLVKVMLLIEEVPPARLLRIANDGLAVQPAE
jgi:hypothetical protein